MSLHQLGDDAVESLLGVHGITVDSVGTAQAGKDKRKQVVQAALERGLSKLYLRRADVATTHGISKDPRAAVSNRALHSTKGHEGYSMQSAVVKGLCVRVEVIILIVSMLSVHVIATLNPCTW